MEMIIYAAIFSAVSLLVVQSLLIITRSFGMIGLTRDINISASTAMERIVREIRFANGIDVANSTFDASPGRLKLNTVDALGAPTTIEFFVNDAVLMIKEGTSAAMPLTSSSTEITTLIFNNITNSSISKAVKITFDIFKSKGSLQKSEKFYNTVILRGS